MAQSFEITRPASPVAGVKQGDKVKLRCHFHGPELDAKIRGAVHNSVSSDFTEDLVAQIDWISKDGRQIRALVHECKHLEKDMAFALGPEEIWEIMK